MSLSFGSGPWSLVRRFSVLVLTLGLVSLAIQFLVLRLWTAPLFDDHVRGLALQVRIIHTALRQSAPADRPALARALSRGPVLLDHEPPDDLGDETALTDAGDESTVDVPARAGSAAVPHQSPARAVGSPLAARLATMLGVVKLHPGRPDTLLFELPVDGDVWWLSLRASAQPQAVVNTVLLWLALLGLVTLLAIVLGLRWIARPIRSLAAQIAQQRGALRPLTSYPQASAEIQAVVRAFNELVHANAMASSLRQQLLAGVSHDLRTPLARLRLRIETQCEQPLADALEADLIALQHIVDQFLAYVQGDTGLRLGSDRPLAAVLAEVADSYAAQGLDVAVAPESLAEDAPEPHLPDLAARRLLENLVSNAIAHGRTPVLLSLRAEGEAEDEEADDKSWLLTVADQGPGMSPKEFAQARQPFVRLNDTRSALGHCGLGLAIVEQIALQFGADLQVRPRGTAASFAVLLRWPRQPSAIG